MFTDEIIVKKSMRRHKGTYYEFSVIYLLRNIVEKLGMNIGDDIVICYKRGFAPHRDLACREVRHMKEV